MAELSLETKLYLLKDDDWEISSYAMDLLGDKFGRGTAKVIRSLLREEGSENGKTELLASSEDMSVETAAEIAEKIATVKNTEKAPTENIMEVYRMEDDFCKKAGRQLALEAFGNYVYDLIHHVYPTYAKKYINELYQCGVEGMFKAMDSYDENKGVFITHARSFILHEINRQINFHSNDLTPHYYGLQKTVNDAKSKISSAGMEVNDRKVEIMTGLKPEKIKKENDFSNRTNFMYLDDDGDTSTNEIEDTMHKSPEAIVTERERREILHEALDNLSEKERLALHLKFEENKTNEEAADDMNEILKPERKITAGQVKVLSNEAIQKMKKDERLNDAFPDYQTRAERDMRQYAVPIMPSEETVDEEMEDLQFVVDMLGEGDTEEMESAGTVSFNLQENSDKNNQRKK